MAVLGGLFVAPVRWNEVGERVALDDFADPRHRLIFQTMAELAALHIPLDLVTVGDAMEAAGRLPRAEDFAYLAVLVRDTPSAANVLAYADVVRGYARRRALLRLADDLAGWARQGDADAAIARLREGLDRQAAVDVVGLRPLSAIMPEVLDALDERATRTHALLGTGTGLAALDDLTDGLAPGRLYVVSGRPGTGKSVLSLQLAREAFTAGKSVALFSLEMPADEVTHRLLAADIPMDLSKIHAARLDSGDWDCVAHSAARLAPAGLWIDDSSHLTVDDLAGRVRRLHRKTPVGLVVVDYIGLLDSARKTDNRVLEIGDITRRLKQLAKELSAPVVAVAQLNRKLEERGDKRPILSDLRESGSVEQDADVVMFIYRDELYNPDSMDRGCVEILIRKNRGGPTGMVPAVFSGAHCRILPLAGPLPSSIAKAGEMNSQSRGFRRREAA